MATNQAGVVQAPLHSSVHDDGGIWRIRRPLDFGWWGTKGNGLSFRMIPTKRWEAHGRLTVTGRAKDYMSIGPGLREDCSARRHGAGWGAVLQFCKTETTADETRCSIWAAAGCPKSKETSAPQALAFLTKAMGCSPQIPQRNLGHPVLWPATAKQRDSNTIAINAANLSRQEKM